MSLSVLALVTRPVYSSFVYVKKDQPGASGSNKVRTENLLEVLRFVETHKTNTYKCRVRYV